MHVIAVINYKGGVGKTSVTANLASQLARQGYRILLLDMDAQASLTFSFIKPEIWKEKFSKTKTIKKWFDSISQQEKLSLSSLIIDPDPVNSKIKASKTNGRLSLIASHLGLINVDLDLATQLGGANLSQVKSNYIKVHRWLKDGIQDLEQRNEYDILLIDCPPNFNIVTKNTIIASDHILIPAKPDYLSTLGIDYLIKNVNKLIGEYNEFLNLDSDKPEEAINPKILGVVFTMVEIRNGDPIASLRPFIRQTKQLGLPIFEQYLRENKTLYADAPQYGLPVVLGKHSNSTHQQVVSELENLSKQFIERLGISGK